MFDRFEIEQMIANSNKVEEMLIFFCFPNCYHLCHHNADYDFPYQALVRMLTPISPFTL
jgi:hypothetical protein